MRLRLRSIAIASSLVCLPWLAAAQDVEVLHRFEVPPHAAVGGLVEAADGHLYGTTSRGGLGGGTIYRVPAGGGAPVTVHRFAHGRRPEATLVRGQDGVLFGTTTDGGAGEGGTVFRFDPATSQLVTLRTFAGQDGRDPVGPVMQASDGLLYGTTAAPGGGRVYAIDPVTGRTRWLHTFDAAGPLGAAPSGGFVEAANGFLYGVMERIGAAQTGTIVKLDRASGAVTRVHAFDGLNGARPVGLTRTTDGMIFGVARGAGGAGAVVVRIDPTTDAVVIANALPTAGDGFTSRLVEAADGALYGTTVFGSIVRLSGGGGVTNLVHTLDAATSGFGLQADLALASDGWIYGATASGGPNGGGTLFRFDSLQRGVGGDPFQFQVIDTWSTRASGWRPIGHPVAAAGGDLYGLTEAGGEHGAGVVWRLVPSTRAFSVVGPVSLSTASGSSAPRHSPLVRFGSDFYALVGTTSHAARRLIRVTPSTGTVSQVHEFPSQSGGLRVLPTLAAGPGGLYGIRLGTGGAEVFRFDLATPATPAVGSIASFFPDGIEAAGMTATADGKLYIQAFVRIPVDGDGPSTIAQLVEVDASSGAARLLATVPDGGAAAPALSPNGFVYFAGHVRFAFGPQLRAVHPTTLAVLSLCTPPVRGAITGVEVDGDGTAYITIDETAAGASTWACDASTSQTARYGVVDAPPDGDRVSRVVRAPDLAWYGTNAATTVDGPEIVFRLPASLPWLDRDGDGMSDFDEERYGLDPLSASGDDGRFGDPDGDGVFNLNDPHPRGFFRRYLAEGTNNAFFRTRVSLLNPGSTPATVLVRFLQDTGGLASQRLVLPAGTQRTLDTWTFENNDPATFSIIVDSDVFVAVDRTMSWGADGYGSHTETAVASLSPTWYFAEGSTSGDFELFYLLQNPHDVGVTAVVRYLRPFNQAPIERQYALRPRSRTTIPVDADPALASTDVSAVVTATAPIMAERAMYRSTADRPFSAGHASAGVVAPALEWFLAEGATGPFFDLFVLLANPNPSPASVTVDYLLAGGGLRTKTYTVAANGRSTIWVDDEAFPAGSGQRPLANVPVSMAVRSINGVPIIVERTMWWPGPELGPDFWYESHNSVGATATALGWAIGGGEAGGPDGTETYVLIANPSTTAGRALVRLHFANGNSTGAFYDLPAQSRSNVALSSAFPEAAVERTAGVTVESVGASPVPIVVEQAIYASPGGVTWTRGSNALAAPMP